VSLHQDKEDQEGGGTLQDCHGGGADAAPLLQKATNKKNVNGLTIGSKFPWLGIRVDAYYLLALAAESVDTHYYLLASDSECSS
jgi:hypothetical protein